MDEPNFEPDYAAWWSKEDITQSDLSWLILGVDPDDIRKRDSLGRSKPIGELGRHSLSEWEAHMEMLSTCLLLPPPMDIEAAHACLMGLSWTGDRRAFVEEACNRRLILSHTGYANTQRAFWEPLMPKNVSLEKYKDHSQYSVDLHTIDISSVKTEEHAFAIICGLDGPCFSRFLKIHSRQQELVWSSGTNKTLSSSDVDDMLFYAEYASFLSAKLLGKKGRTYAASDLHNTYHDANALKIWEGNCAQYIQGIYNSRLALPEEFYDPLRSLGLDISYQEEGEIRSYYKRVIQEGLWSLHEAACFYLRIDPKDSDLGGIVPGIKSPPFFRPIPGKMGRHLFCTEEYVVLDSRGFPDRDLSGETKQKLEDLVEKNMGNEEIKEAVKPTETNGIQKFIPKNIILFLREHFPCTSEPIALFEELDIKRRPLSKPPCTQGKPQKRGRGRTKGSGEYDDSEHVIKMHQLIESKEAKSPHDAAWQAVRSGDVKGARDESSVFRLIRKYKKTYPDNELGRI